MNPVRSALQNRAVVLVLTAFAVLLGVRALLTMPRREDPKITIRTGLVLARYPGATATQVEEQVTRKIEEQLFRHQEVRKLKTFSTSRDGVVVVNVELEEWVKDPDRFWAMLRHDMNELHATDLPPTVQGPIVNSNFGDVVAMLLAVRGPQYGPRELREYLDRIDDAIRTIPEVSKINRLGEQREELRVSTTNARLAGFGITPFQVAGAIRARNAVQDAGTVDVGDGGRVPIDARSLLGSEDALSRLLVGSSRDGRPVHVGDFATVERRYADPSFVVRVDGEPTVLLAVEMQEGHNIVEFGNTVREKIAELRPTLPPDLVIQAIADQPDHVQHRMIEFGREFLITLAAVILVTLLLLPLRVAAIAAVAIPITVAITVSILNAVGIELHQVTFAGLVVALGIVVDDAIVVVDNYVEKLDHGMSRFEAAWRSPTELAIPVLAATLTIVASFLPLAYLPGAPGEFIRAMSFTVAIALMVSFAVAMLLTPLLALTLVKKGLHDPSTAQNVKQRPSPLDVMQSVYERIMSSAMPRKRLTIVGAVVAFVAGLALMSAVPYRFFPMNERDQFLIDLWMPAGTRIAGTDEVLRRLETDIRGEKGVRSVAAFVGGGAPRFYYNHNPEPPTPNFGEMLINTTSPDATDELVRTLQKRLDKLAPEGWVYIKPLQQGPVFAAPNEIRLIGDNEQLLLTYGDSVSRIFEHTPGSAYVHTDWRDEELSLGVRVREEAATRLGLTDADIAGQLAGAFSGAPISTFWEGKRDIDVTLRLDESERSAIDDVASAYVVSPTTSAKIPLREVADISPDFRPSRIVRRNGLRTLTVLSFAKPDILPSVVLKAATPELAALKLPAGMRMEFGGEKEGSAEVQGAVNLALLTSLLGVFFILLFQFRTVRHPLVVMTSIPLAVVGAAIGLVVTGNPFTYTANLGLNALTGVVVRNAIILVDYANELRKNGIDIETAALLAGRRRLRPIFLTTMAAALGVTPMILSRSPLWSPMASVIAVGLVVSMIFTLVLVPVLYVVVEKRIARRAAKKDAILADVAKLPGVPAPAHGIAAMTPAATTAMLLLLLSAPARRASAQSVILSAAKDLPSVVRTLTIDQAIDLALTNGYTTRIAAARASAAEAHERAAIADALPQLAVSGNSLRSSGRTTIVVPQGALGNESSGAPLPALDRRFDQGAATLTYTQFALTQPITQLWRIRQAQQLALAQTNGAAAERSRAVADARLAIERLYASVLIARAREHAADAALLAKRRQSGDVQLAVASGIEVTAQSLGARAAALDAEYARTTAEDAISDAESELRSALALPPGARFELVVPERDSVSLMLYERYVTQAEATNADVASARATLAQAQRGVALARAEYIPDLGVGVTYTMLNGVSFLPKRAVGLSIQGSWTLFDGGRRASQARERVAQQEAAEVALALARDRVAVEVDRAYRGAARAERGAAVAREALDARRAIVAVARDRDSRGLASASVLADAEAQLAASEAQVLAAELQIRIARAELRRAVGG